MRPFPETVVSGRWPVASYSLFLAEESVELVAAGGYGGFFASCLDEHPTGAVSNRFFHEPAAGRSLVRFAFCKTDEMLREAGERLAAIRTRAVP